MAEMGVSFGDTMALMRPLAARRSTAVKWMRPAASIGRLSRLNHGGASAASEGPRAAGRGRIWSTGRQGRYPNGSWIMAKLETEVVPGSGQRYGKRQAGRITLRRGLIDA